MNGARVAVKIETHVAPQAGLGSGSGRLDDRPSDDWGQWTINGVTYQGDRAIEVNLRSPAALGAATTKNVMVNYYVLDGARYATFVIELPNRVFMPITQR